MNLLLDTHTAVWVTLDAPRLGRAARRACNVALAADQLEIPTLVYYELSEILKRHRVAGASSVREWRHRILSLGIREVELTAEIAIRASDLENLPGDPFDRLVVATALVQEAVLLTADEPILSWPGPVRRQDAQR
jgi:PIN domain nuclease of toxin-antitoxin system